jgi:D-apionolactonase
VFPSEPAAIDSARRGFAQALVGGGTPHFFVQLNRAERLGEPDFLSFTTSPLVHGACDAEVMQSLHSLPSMLETLHARFGALLEQAQ